MSWIDFLIIFIFVYNIVRSFRAGFIKSVFSIAQYILIIYLTKQFYPYFYGYIKDTPEIYNVLLKIFESLMGAICFRKAKADPNFLTDLMYKGAFSVFINFICLIIFYFIVKWILKLIFKLISFIFEAPVLKQLNKLGGIIFGSIKGILIIYIAFILLTPYSKMYPESFIGKGIENSVFSNYIIKTGDVFNIFNFKNQIL